VPIIAAYERLPFSAAVLSASNAMRSLSDSPAGMGPPSLSVLMISDGTVAGRLMWMPSNPDGVWRVSGYLIR